MTDRLSENGPELRHGADQASLPRNTILIGDALAELRKLPSSSVDMVFTSPPYFNLRDYGVGGGAGEIGREAHVDEWVEALVKVSLECARVLVPTGTLWINVGDTYSAGSRHGAERKSLLLGPSRLALRLIQSGLLLRNDIIWHKANHLPHPVADRLTPAWEHLFLFAVQPDYYFDLDAIREPHTSKLPRARRDANGRGAGARAGQSPAGGAGGHPTGRASTHPRGRDDRVGSRRSLGNARRQMLGSAGLKAMHADGRVGHPLGKNPGDVWRVPSSQYRGAHRATMPVELARRAIRAACPSARHVSGCRAATDNRDRKNGPSQPACDCRPGIVLDPFMGSGTTGLAARELERDWLGIELNAEYAALAAERIESARGAAGFAAQASENRTTGAGADESHEGTDNVNERRGDE